MTRGRKTRNTQVWWEKKKKKDWQIEIRWSREKRFHDDLSSFPIFSSFFFNIPSLFFNPIEIGQLFESVCVCVATIGGSLDFWNRFRSLFVQCRLVSSLKKLRNNKDLPTDRGSLRKFFFFFFFLYHWIRNEPRKRKMVNENLYSSSLSVNFVSVWGSLPAGISNSLYN